MIKINTLIDEMVFSDESLISFSSFIKNIIRSICLIQLNKYDHNGNNSGTGFFVEISIPSRELPLKGLMTNNHVLNERALKPNSIINIYFPDNNNKHYSISINEEDFVFTSELIDVTFIELNDEMIEKIDPYFLKPSSEETEINESVIIFQFPKKIFSMAHGNITSSHSFNFHHKVSTDEGSSGAPLLNSNFKVVGVHKFSISNGNIETGVNIAVKFSEIEFAIGIVYYSKFIYGNKRTRKSVRPLLDTEIEILNEYGLELGISSKEKKNLKKKKISLREIKIIEKSLFRCDLFGNSLLFYRTNYAWYITILSKDNNISIYSLDNLKKLDWSPIIPNTNELDKNILSKINENEYILITWLKLTELRYL
jgi:hypothetical protein